MRRHYLACCQKKSLDIRGFKAFLVDDTSDLGYERLKCENCGKPLGFMRLGLKIYPPKTLIRLASGGPIVNVEKEVHCKECFRRLAESKKEHGPSTQQHE
jgi:ribosomal protein S14